MRPTSPFDAISSVLTSLAQRLGVEAKVLEHRLRRRWPAIVGAHLAAHTRPDQIRYRKLYLIVENSVWLHQLSFLKTTLVEKVNADAGSTVVSEVVLRVGEIPSEQAEESTAGRPEPTSPSADAVAQAAALAAEIRDPELRSLLTSARAAALSSSAPPPRTASGSEPSEVP